MNTSGALKQAGYSPPAGTPSGIPGASYPVLGSTPVSNMQPRYGSPGMAQIRPGMAPPPLMQQGPSIGTGRNGEPLQMDSQKLAQALAAFERG